AHTGALRLFAHDHVEAEVLHARAAVSLRYGHAEKTARARRRVHLARHDPGLLPRAVAALIALYLALAERATARPEVFVPVLEQSPPHHLGPYSRQECEAHTSNKTADEARRGPDTRSTPGERSRAQSTPGEGRAGAYGRRAGVAFWTRAERCADRSIRPGGQLERASEPVQVHPRPLRRVLALAEGRGPVHRRPSRRGRLPDR